MRLFYFNRWLNNTNWIFNPLRQRGGSILIILDNKGMTKAVGYNYVLLMSNRYKP